MARQFIHEHPLVTILEHANDYEHMAIRVPRVADLK